MYEVDIEIEMTVDDYYRLYLHNHNDGTGRDYQTGKPLKDFCEWRGDRYGYSIA